MRHLVSSALAVVASIVLVTAGCGSKKSGFDDTPDSGTLGSGDPNLNGDGGGGVVCTAAHCSSDLHSLVDCNGTVLMTCPPDQGCSGTGCVAACDSARDNKSNIGCDYYSVDPDVILDGAGACFAAFVA